MLLHDIDDIARTLSVLGGILSIIVASLTISPTLRGRLARWLLQSADPQDLPHDAPLRRLGDRIDTIQDSLDELQRDTVKNTILHLMRDDGEDHSQEIAYELAKLRKLGGDCWVVDAAESYLLAHMGVKDMGVKPGKERQ